MTHPKSSISETPLYDKVYCLYLFLHLFSSKIPKSKRYTLWQKCENTTLEILEMLISASHSKNDKRTDCIIKISEKLDLLKTLIRLAKDTKTIPEKQYISLQSLIQEIGKMTGGWLKSVSHWVSSIPVGKESRISKGHPRLCSDCRCCCWHSTRPRQSRQTNVRTLVLRSFYYHQEKTHPFLAFHLKSKLYQIPLTDPNTEFLITLHSPKINLTLGLWHKSHHVT